MDWVAAEAGLKAWVAAASGIAPAQVAWDSEAVGQRIYPIVDLRFFDHRARDGMTPEVVYPEPDAEGKIAPIAVAQRACSWSITVTTRDQRANKKAYVVLDELAVLLALPWSGEAVAALGISILDMGRVIPNHDVPSDHRELSVATLTLQCGYVTTATLPDTVEGLDVIEHAEIGGTALDADLTTPIDVPPEITPPLP
jgi:hypothetical protein